MKNYYLHLIILCTIISCARKEVSQPLNKLNMNATIVVRHQEYLIDLNDPIDISLAVQHKAGVGAWYIDQPKISHVEVDGII